MQMCIQLLRAMSIAAQVSAAARKFPGAVAPAIIAGTLAGCGGRLVCDSLESVAGIRSSFELAKPTFILRSSLVNASLFYILVHVLKAFTIMQGLGLLMVFALVYTLTDDLTAKAVDVSTHVTNVFTTITLITPPAAKPASRGRAKTSKTPAAATTPRASSRRRSTSRKR